MFAEATAHAFEPGSQSRKLEFPEANLIFWMCTCKSCMQKRAAGSSIRRSATLTRDLKARTSTLLAELFMADAWVPMGGSGKLQYSLSFVVPKLTIKPLRA